MLILGVLFLLFSASIVSVYLRIKGIRLAYIWLILVLSITLSWIILMVIQPENISPLTIRNWININNSPVPLIFSITETNWPISIGYFSFILAYLLTSIIHLNGNKSLFDWLEILFLFITGWIFLLAGDYWSILIGWTLIDFVELIFHFRHKSLNPENFFSHFSIKFIGSLLLMYAISRSYQLNPTSLFENSPQEIGLILPLAAFLHSGFVSNYLEKYSKNEDPANMNIIFMKIISFITSFFILTYSSVLNLNIFSSFVIRLIVFVYGSIEMVRWAASDDDVPRIDRMLFGFGAVVSLLYLSGSGEFISVWLIGLLFPIGWLYLFTDRDSKLNIFLFLILLFISGFPFSLIFPALNGLFIQRKWFDLLMLFVLMTILISGYLNHGLKKSGNLNVQESWFQVIYMVGLFLPIISLTLIGLKTITAPIENISVWLIGAGLVIFAFLLFLTQFRPGNAAKKLHDYQKIGFGWGSKILPVFQNVYKASTTILDSSMMFISRLFEGDGGILWSIVFLALFLTILKFQGNP